MKHWSICLITPPAFAHRLQNRGVTFWNVQTQITLCPHANFKKKIWPCYYRTQYTVILYTIVNNYSVTEVRGLVSFMLNFLYRLTTLFFGHNSINQAFFYSILFYIINTLKWPYSHEIIYFPEASTFATCSSLCLCYKLGIYRNIPSLLSV